jgi:hypothetical protein
VASVAIVPNGLQEFKAGIQTPFASLSRSHFFA